MDQNLFYLLALVVVFYVSMRYGLLNKFLKGKKADVAVEELNEDDAHPFTIQIGNVKWNYRGAKRIKSTETGGWIRKITLEYHGQVITKDVRKGELVLDEDSEDTMSNLSTRLIYAPLSSNVSTLVSDLRHQLEEANVQILALRNMLKEKSKDISVQMQDMVKEQSNLNSARTTFGYPRQSSESDGGDIDSSSI